MPISNCTHSHLISISEIARWTSIAENRRIHFCKQITWCLSIHMLRECATNKPPTDVANPFDLSRWWDLFSFLSLHYCFSVFICASYETIEHIFGCVCASSVWSDSTHVRAFRFLTSLTTPSKTSPSERKRKKKKKNKTHCNICVYEFTFIFTSLLVMAIAAKAAEHCVEA